MQVHGLVVIDNFIKKHPQAKKPLYRWVEMTRNVDWKKFSDIKNTFSSADMVKGEKNRVWFNIGGNKYRLKAAIDYDGSIVITQCVLTHADYSKI
ncbi:MAG: type II toxin-antitoxin system HigB family toxin [Sedimentisphaerales bacterium]|nr:type II toxin-antitoxin system HigB family toxin [Sedimentisphaerales bacterium]MBN2843754.1 type II toxin-antitoxin system HigB family toxin [Sedimentisphaerales bacterium]